MPTPHTQAGWTMRMAVPWLCRTACATGVEPFPPEIIPPAEGAIQRIEDPVGVSPPVALSIRGRTAAGAYLLEDEGRLAGGKN